MTTQSTTAYPQKTADYVQKLSDAGYQKKPAAKSKKGAGKNESTYRGKRLASETWVLGEDEKLGKVVQLAAMIPVAAAHTVYDAFTSGWTAADNSFALDGIEMAKAPYDASKGKRGHGASSWKKVKEIANSDAPKVGKEVRLAAAVAAVGSVVFAPLFLSEKFRVEIKKFFGETKTVHIEQPQEDPEIESKKLGLGYVATRSDTIVEHVQNLISSPSEARRSLVREIGGYYVVLETKRPGVSSFLLVKSDFSSGKSIKFFYTKDGAPVTNPADQWDAIQDYIAYKNDPETRANAHKEIDKLAKQMASKAGISPEDDEYDEKLKQFRKTLKKQKGILVLGTTSARIYGKSLDPNKSIHSATSGGTSVEYSKRFKNDRGKRDATLEHKGSSEGKPAFASSPLYPPKEGFSVPPAGKRADGGKEKEKEKERDYSPPVSRTRGNDSGPQIVELGDDDDSEIELD